MIEQLSPFTIDQIGTGTARFSSSGVFDTHKDQMVNPYAATLQPKEAQVECLQYWPQSKGRFPCVILLHDRWGLTSQIKDLGKQLACEGYVVLIPNLYGRLGGMVTANAEVANALAERLHVVDALQDIRACCEFLNANLSEDTELEYTKRNTHAVVGFGLGGSLALQFACKRKRLRAAVAFYSHLPVQLEMLQELQCPILYHAAEQENCVTPEVQGQMIQIANEYNKTIDIQTYPKTCHGFHDESHLDDYNAAAAQQAWKATLSFLKTQLAH
ncbi:MAG: hypothetical protein GKS05_12660 [Nitrospirales bacterium]|nr:hypothetical protein [Nitrospirales bacterium]